MKLAGCDNYQHPGKKIMKIQIDSDWRMYRGIGRVESIQRFWGLLSFLKVEGKRLKGEGFSNSEVGMRKGEIEEFGSGKLLKAEWEKVKDRSWEV